MEPLLCGVDYQHVPSRVCTHCGYRLPLEYFALTAKGQRGKECIVCGTAKRGARPWTTEQLDAVLRAARGVLDLWAEHLEDWTEADLERLRALLEAVDRLPLRTDKET